MEHIFSETGVGPIRSGNVIPLTGDFLQPWNEPRRKFDLKYRLVRLNFDRTL